MANEKSYNEELQNEIDRVWKTCNPVDEGMGVETANVHIEQFDAIARYFVRWQEERDKETIELAEDHAYFAGSVNEREKMLKEAVEGVLVDNVDGTQEICLHGNRYGDKVHVIIVKENEKR